MHLRFMVDRISDAKVDSEWCFIDYEVKFYSYTMMLGASKCKAFDVVFGAKKDTTLSLMMLERIRSYANEDFDIFGARKEFCFFTKSKLRFM